MQVWIDQSEVQFSKDHILTLGTFDGIHRGHAGMLGHVVDTAKECGSKSVAITLHPHPRIVLGKADGLELLSSLSERIELFRTNDIDILYIMKFDLELARTSPEEFVLNKLFGDIGFRKLIVGYDHAFGRNREGDFELLEKISSENGFEIERYEAQSVNGEIISSTKIRNSLNNGEIVKANGMLGYDYFVIGKVVEGDKRGRKIGFPTANIEPEEPRKIIPENGVYAVTLEVDGNNYAAVCNIGVRPTFKLDGLKTIEVHIPATELDLYNSVVKLSFHDKIRDEAKFQGVDEIIEQIENDVSSSKNILKDLEGISKYINFVDYIER